MSDNVSRFCDSIHEKLEMLEGRMGCLKLNAGSNWHSLQEKLDEVRRKGEATKPVVAEARISLERWFKENKAAAKDMIDRWIENRETQKLAARAQKAEDCAGIAIVIAQASIDDAERMVLEAIAARLDAEAVIHAEPAAVGV